MSINHSEYRERVRQYGANLRRIRTGLNLSLKAVGKMAGVDAADISCIERGLQRANPSQRRRIERALGLDPTIELTERIKKRSSPA